MTGDVKLDLGTSKHGWVCSFPLNPKRGSAPPNSWTPPQTTEYEKPSQKETNRFAGAPVSLLWIQHEVLVSGFCIAASWFAGIRAMKGFRQRSVCPAAMRCMVSLGFGTHQLTYPPAGWHGTPLAMHFVPSPFGLPTETHIHDAHIDGDHGSHVY